MQLIKAHNFTNVGAGLKAILEFPLGMTYSRIVLQLGGVFTKAQIDRIVLKLNGKIFYDISGTNLDLLNKYRQIFDDAAFITLDFIEPRAMNLGGMYAGAIDTSAGVNSFTAEVDINAAAVGPTLQAWYQQLPPMLKPDGTTGLDLIMALIPTPVTFGALGKFMVPAQKNGQFIKRCHFFSAILTSLEVRKNGLVIFDDTPAAVNSFIQNEFENVPQAGLYVYDPILTGDVKQSIPTGDAQSLDYYLTVSGAGAVTMINEYLTQLRSL